MVIKDPNPTEERRFALTHDPVECKIDKVVTVKSLVSTDGRERDHVLTAKQRYGLTASTAWSVLHLSGSSWLGDGWGEEQLQIFIEKSPGNAKLLSKHPMASLSSVRRSTQHRKPIMTSIASFLTKTSSRLGCY